MAITKQDIRDMVADIEQLLNTPIPGTPEITGRVMYAPLPGSERKAENVLSPRALRVYKALVKHKKLTSKALQETLKVNRNVIAGAIFECRSKGVVRSVHA